MTETRPTWKATVSPAALGIRAELKALLLDLLSEGPVPSVEAKQLIRAKIRGASETTMVRARRELGIKVRHVGYGEDSRWVWSL